MFLIETYLKMMLLIKIDKGIEKHIDIISEISPEIKDSLT